MKSFGIFLKLLHCLLVLAFLFGGSFPTLAADEESRFEEAIQRVGTHGVSCFISHAWEGNNPNPLVARLERHLDSAGIVTYFDNRDDERGASAGIANFMNKIVETDYILMVFTPTFKDEYKKKSNVATEVNYVISSLLNSYPEKIVPVLFSGTQDTAIPPLLKPLRYYDFSNPRTYHDQFFKVLNHMLPSRTAELAVLRDCLRTPPPRYVAAEAKPLSTAPRVDAKSSSTLSEAKPSSIARTETKPTAVVSVERPMSTPIPEITRGFEEIYLRFIKGKLIYKPNKDNDIGRIEIPFSALPNPLEGTFDLSRCGDTGKYISIATGYRKGMKTENKNKTEVWIAPKFVVEKNQATTAKHLAPIVGSFPSPVGIFWTWGGWDNSAEKMGCYDYLTTQNFEELSNGENLYEKWFGIWQFRAARRLTATIAATHPAARRTATDDQCGAFKVVNFIFNFN